MADNALFLFAEAINQGQEPPFLHALPDVVARLVESRLVEAGWNALAGPVYEREGLVNPGLRNVRD